MKYLKSSQLGIDRHGSSRYRYFCQYRYRYNCTNISATNTDTDIYNIPMFGRYLPFWPISMIFNQYLADTDITNIYQANTNTDMAYTDI